MILKKVLTEKELEIMYDIKELAPIDRKRFVKNKVNEAIDLALKHPFKKGATKENCEMCQSDMIMKSICIKCKDIMVEKIKEKARADKLFEIKSLIKKRIETMRKEKWRKCDKGTVIMIFDELLSEVEKS